jgi:hypothetical protein
LLDEGEARRLRQRHARWFADTLREAELEPDRDALDRLELERANMLAALDWLEDENDLVELGRVVTRMMLVLPLYTWVDDSNRYLFRADVEAALEREDLAGYALANGLNANAMGDFAKQHDEARRAYGLASCGSAVRLIAASILVNALSVLDPEAGLAVIDEAISELTPASEPTRPLLLAAQADCYITSGRLEEGVRLTYELHELQAARGLLPYGRADFALILHVLGRNDEARKALDFEPLERQMDPHHQRLGHAVMAAVEGHHDNARTQLFDAARAVRRTQTQLLDRDLLITAAALAFWRGDIHRASVLLGVERERLFARSPGSWVLYTHYRDQTRKALSREELDACKAEARELTIQEALSQELGEAWELV